jgi:prevent-host-death family protein
MTTATATEVQNNFGRFLQSAIDGNEIVILKNGKEVARLVSHKSTVSYLTDSLVGVLSRDYDEKQLRAERYEKK